MLNKWKDEKELSFADLYVWQSSQQVGGYERCRGSPQKASRERSGYAAQMLNKWEDEREMSFADLCSMAEF